MDKPTLCSVTIYPICFFQENILLDTMFEVPGSDIIAVTVTKDAVLGTELPRYTHRGDHPDMEDKPLEPQTSQFGSSV